MIIYSHMTNIQKATIVALLIILCCILFSCSTPYRCLDSREYHFYKLWNNGREISNYTGN